MNISLPDFSLVVLIGASGSGKSTFARSHFLSTEIVSSDYCRGLVSDDENSQDASHDAFDLLHFITAKRLARMKLTVIDATNVQSEGRKNLLELAKTYHARPVAIVLDIPDQVSIDRNRERADRQFGPHVITRQRRDLKHSLRGLEREGFREVYVLKSEAQVAQVTINRVPLWTNLKQEHGPFDIIGDIHGCYDELCTLLSQLGYSIEGDIVTPPQGRKAVFLGDLVDRGPKTPLVLRLVMNMVASGTALCVPGNHDVKLMRALQGKNVQLKHGLAESLDQLEAEPAEFKPQVTKFIDSLISHYVLDDGLLIVAHAGMKETMAGRASGAVREFALYGETTGETDEFGLPIRFNWASEYRGKATIVYGHTPVPQAEWLNRTINIDTGCIFGGALTAFRYPENELVSVPAVHTYAEPARPFLNEDAQAPALTTQQLQDDVLEIADVSGKRLINTRLQSNIIIREQNATAALEVMSRFAVNPKWLVYLPPTMSPTATSHLPDLLEYPDGAFGYYRDNGVAAVVCEEKHMGSRAVVVICKDENTARSRFGIIEGGIGMCYTRTGRRFFDNLSLETAFLERIRDAITRSGLWEELQTDWMVLDCELMPWSAKAQELLRGQYAAVGAAAGLSLGEAVTVLKQASIRTPAAGALLTQIENRQQMVKQYVEAYRHYCWPVQSLDDLKLAPFHLLASEGAVHTDKNHLWHMEMLGRLDDAGLIQHTAFQVVDVTDSASIATGTEWWMAMTGRGGEGMVVKPLDFISKGSRGILQPAVKVRGREYLRIIYGPEYTDPTQLNQLRSRGLGAKRSLALREFSLGIEALERFVRKEPLRRVHECVFGVLALESEPVDPRL
ncbi:MAG: polynucleotide kinase-phosphatase [Anaerolineae bacterium]|nr:polynucleotide kinase-phosphatase [Anaerolineae bacterium]